jgi:thiol-disulfide isomerase/thioredoxin
LISLIRLSSLLLTLLFLPTFADYDPEKLDQMKSHIQRVDPLSFDLKTPDFRKQQDWFNSAPLSFERELKGKITVLDFWTYCCINCIHILPDLAFLEKKFEHDPVAFVGVHSAKFDNEKDSENIRQAIIRYEITHPVVNDIELFLWNSLSIRSWPSLAVIGPKGNLLTIFSGEGQRDNLDHFIAAALEFYSSSELNNTPLDIVLEKEKNVPTSPIRFPGKLALDQEGKRLFISDSNQNRILITDLEGQLIDLIGSGIPGLNDGSYAEAQFNRTQGLAYHDNKLYVADTENHAVRLVDLSQHRVHTLIGTGIQGRDYQGGRHGKEQEISSPWDLVLSDELLYVAMAGTHQIWAYNFSTDIMQVFSGYGAEQNFNSHNPLKAAWAQPSGLSIGDGVMFVADSESSSVRSIDLQNLHSKTLVGGDNSNPYNLFSYGDIDGQGDRAKLQHALGVVWWKEKKRIIVADTYNHRLKLLNPEDNTIEKWVGSGKSGYLDGIGLETEFSEPSGFALDDENQKLYVADTNNHFIRLINLKNNQVSTLQVMNNIPKPKTEENARLTDPVRTRVVTSSELRVSPGSEGVISLQIELPQDYHYIEGPLSKWHVLDITSKGLSLLSNDKTGLLLEEQNVSIPFKVGDEFKEGKIELEAVIYYCQENNACFVDSIFFEIPITIGEKSEASVLLIHKIDVPKN